MKVDAAQMKRSGWHILPETLADFESSEMSDVKRRLLQMDLRNIGSGWIPEGLRKNKSGKVDASGVLQIMKIRNIGAPKINEESKTSPRFLRIFATDGKETITLLDMDHHPKLSIDSLPGAKILLKGGLEMWEGHVIIRRDNAEFLGGSVDRLVEAWRLKLDFSATAGPIQRRAADGSGPPPFVAFGSKSKGAVAPNARSARNFRAMDSVRDAGKTTGGPPEPDAEEEAREFQEHRRAVIAEAKKEGNSKLRNFAQQKNVKLPPGRGVDQIERRGDIERMMAMGFKSRDASSALRKAGGDVQKAIDSLLSDQAQGISTKEPPRASGRGRGKRRDRDPFDSDDDDYSTPGIRQPPPSGPATLLDFVTTTKKKGEKENTLDTSDRTQPELKEGQLVNAQWRDGRTYRARVEEVFKPDGVIGVFYLDYAEHDVIPIGHVTPLPNAKNHETPLDAQSARKPQSEQPGRKPQFQQPDYSNPGRPRNQDRDRSHRHQSFGGGGHFNDSRPPKQPQQHQQDYHQQQQYHQQHPQQRQQFAGRPHQSHPNQAPNHNRPQPPQFNQQFPPTQSYPRGQPYHDNGLSDENHARQFYSQPLPQQFDYRHQMQQQQYQQQHRGGYQQQFEYYEGCPTPQTRPQSMDDNRSYPRPGVHHGNMQFVRGGQGRAFNVRR